MSTLILIQRFSFDLRPLPALSPGTSALGCSCMTRHGHFCDKAYSHTLRPCAISHTSSLEFESSILNFILWGALHRSTSHRPRYIPTGPTCATLKRLGTRSARNGWHAVLQHHNSLQWRSLRLNVNTHSHSEVLIRPPPVTCT